MLKNTFLLFLNHIETHFASILRMQNAQLSFLSDIGNQSYKTIRITIIENQPSKRNMSVS